MAAGNLRPLAQQLVDLGVTEGVAEADGGAAGEVGGQVVQEPLARLFAVLSGELPEQVLQRSLDAVGPQEAGSGVDREPLSEGLDLKAEAVSSSAVQRPLL